MHPNGASDMVNGVVKTYEAGYKVWSEAYVPKLLFRPNWFRNESDLEGGDLVYFQKSKLGCPCTLGMIDELEKGRDGLIRKVQIKYRNAIENQDRKRYKMTRTK